MIRNITKKNLLAPKTLFALTAGQKCRGLMFTKKGFLDGKGMVFVFSHEQKIGLHMMFVKYPIDVLWLDSQKRVVGIVEGFCPWRFFSPAKKAQYVIELPAGIIEKTKTEIGNTIRF